MKRITCIVLLSSAVMFSHNRNIFPYELNIKDDNINAEPIHDKPHQYSVNIKFSRIKKVLVSTNIAVEASGQKREVYTLLKKEWNYDYDRNILVINRDIDDSKYIVRVTGKYRTPVLIIPSTEINSSSIRFVVNGKIGIKGKDYRYDETHNVIELPACKTGKEKFIINYDYTGGSSSIGSAGMAELTLPLLRYLNFPIKGNAVLMDNKGLKFSPGDIHYKSVWLVQLIPVKDGYTGRDIITGFHWNQGRNELTLDTPVDTQRFSIMIYGEAE